MSANFFLKDSLDNKAAKKVIRIIMRFKIIPIEEIECLYISTVAPATQDFVVCTKNEVLYRKALTIAPARFEYSSITTVTIESRFASPCVVLTIGQGEKVILHVISNNATPLSEFIKNKMQSPSSPQSPLADEIRKYKELLDIGAITQSEFNAKKKQLLSI